MTSKEQREENRKAWVAALRGGAYEQGRGRLEKNGTFCCLGVACHALYGDSVDGRWDGSFALAPKKLIDDLGLRDEQGELNDPYGKLVFPSLIDANDDGASFAEIADLIEKHPEAVFAPDMPIDPLFYGEDK